MLAEQADRRRGALRRLPGQLEVAVGGHRTVGELDDADAILDGLALDGVVMTLHLAEREAGLQPHGDGDRIDRRIVARIEHRRGDAVAVGPGIVPLAGYFAPAPPIGPPHEGLHTLT